MTITDGQKRAVALGALGLGALLATRTVGRRGGYNFAGKSVVITGGSRGLGLVLARQLADLDARLTLIARSEDELQRASDELVARFPQMKILTLRADVRRQDDAERAIAQAFDRHGAIDVLINNAGIIQVGPLRHMAIADFEDAMSTHFWGPLYLVMAALPHMRRQGHGRVVNISSIGGKIAVPHMVPYSASKFALAGLSDGLRAELAAENIVVTTVCPGLMRTGSPINAMFKGRHAREYAWFAISDSLPLATIDAERAARQIVNACRRGDAELIITLQARLAVMAQAIAPELVADGLALMARILPAPAGRSGNVAEPGRANESSWAPSALTEPTYEAARRNNEM